MSKASSDARGGAGAIRVVIVEDDAGLRVALRKVFDASRDFVVEACYADAESALAAVLDLKPDVVLMDIGLPGLSGIECVRLVKSHVPSIKVVMLTVYDDNDMLFQSLQAGADGYLLKRATSRKLLESVREIAAGGAPISPQIARRMVEYFHQIREGAPRGATDAAGQQLGCLTPQEQQILGKLSEGMVPKEVAAAMGISWETVRKHLTNIYAKMHVHSRTEAVLKFLGHRLTPLGCDGRRADARGLPHE